MTGAPLPDEIGQWLMAATRGLPVHIAAVVRGELTAHYQDALEAHCQVGMTREEAHQAALAELGDANEVADGMRVAHLSRQRSLAGMLAGLCYPILIVLMPTFAQLFGEEGGYLVQDVLNSIVLIFILGTFIRLIGFNPARLERPGGLLMVAIALGTVSRLAAMVILGNLPLASAGDALVWDNHSLVGILIDGAFIGAEALTAGACFWLGVRLYRSEEKMFGLLPPLSVLLMLVCPIGLGVSVSLVLGSMLAAEIFSILGYMLVTTLLAVMIYIFYRAAFGRNIRPDLIA
jgi:hypothetical protein